MTAYAAITGPAVPLSRGDLRWETTVPDDGSLPMGGGFPSLIAWGDGMTPPPEKLPDSGCTLQGLTVTHPNAAWLAGTLMIDGPPVRFIEGPMALKTEIETPTGPRTLASN